MGSGWENLPSQREVSIEQMRGNAELQKTSPAEGPSKYKKFVYINTEIQKKIDQKTKKSTE